MTRNYKLFYKILLVAVISLIGTAPAFASGVQSTTAARTKQDIILNWNKYKPMAIGFDYMAKSDIYEMPPVLSPPYSPGKLKVDYISDGINAVNFVRYLAGLPDDIQPDWSLGQQEQAAALVNAVNDELTHFPAKPKDMDEELFALGYKGTSSSNLFAGDPTLFSNVLGYMSDSDTSNIDRVGHRRWILNPAMKKTMFGFVQTKGDYPYPYASMYAFNRDRAEGAVDYDYIAWPSAGYFPSEIFVPKDAWSVSLNPDKYDNARTDKIQVSLTRISDNKTWSINQADVNKEGRFMNVETGGFGIPFCIIFRPDNLDAFKEDDTFRVQISGVYDKSGNSAAISYDTTFFTMLPAVTVRAKELKLEPGEKLRLATTGKPNTEVSFESDDPAIAAVDESGSVTARAEGRTRLVVRSYFQNEQIVHINVVKPGSSGQVSAWALDGYNKAKSNGIIRSFFDEDYQSPMNRYGFAVMAVQLCENILGKPLETTTTPFKDINDTTISKAVKNGLIQGTSKTEFSPWNTITRQEAAVMLIRLHDRLLRLMGDNAAAGNSLAAGGAAFADDARIAPWAKEYVYRAVDLQLLNGVGNNKFEPRGLLTHEQTFIILEHVFEKFVTE
ncbi:S-layer homology domain-containing protein [Paenibacillus sp. sptzw28]|uniref:S-layer homology domain-containing protein n=1 Tax=Paenibacillus sp. sptzw28 TaxID=715179 RepID=UPI001C6DD932|nr:S-layer homology domain-containing protein [Paenibacillus sp. sptzw28]QYR22138.1 S-layer homology domain-containing protein [Paenibacillus sp. sptzw28]